MYDICKSRTVCQVDDDERPFVLSGSAKEMLGYLKDREVNAVELTLQDKTKV